MIFPYAEMNTLHILDAWASQSLLFQHVLVFGFMECLKVVALLVCNFHHLLDFFLQCLPCI